MKALLAALALTLSAATIATAQPQRLSAPIGLAYEWKTIPTNADQVALLKNGKQVGNWHIEAQEYHPVRGDGWGAACKPPVAVPEWAVREKAEEPIANFGIVLEAMRTDTPRGAHKSGERITCNGEPISRAEFHRAIEDGAQDKGIPNDADKFRLIIAGTDDERKAVEKDWAAAPKELKDKVAIWSVPADHWSLRDNVTGAPMFPCAKSGKGVCLTTSADKDGKSEIIYFEADYRGPGDFEAIRKAIEIAEGRAYPGRSGGPILSANVQPTAIGGAAALAIAAGVYARRRRSHK